MIRESLSAWLGLPWRCKFRHVPVEQRDYEPNTGYLFETWFDCGRCGNFLRHGEFRG